MKGWDRDVGNMICRQAMSIRQAGGRIKTGGRPWSDVFWTKTNNKG